MRCRAMGEDEKEPHRREWEAGWVGVYIVPREQGLLELPPVSPEPHPREGPARQVLLPRRSTRSSDLSIIHTPSLDTPPAYVLFFYMPPDEPASDGLHSPPAEADTPFGPSGVAHPPQRDPVPEVNIAGAIQSAGGNLTKTARALAEMGTPLSRSALKSRIDSSIALTLIMKELIDGYLDQAEDNVFDLVMKGDAAESHYLLDRLGKERGWVTRSENKNLEPLQVAVRTFSEPAPDVE